MKGFAHELWTSVGKEPCHGTKAAMEEGRHHLISLTETIWSKEGFYRKDFLAK